MEEGEEGGKVGRAGEKYDTKEDTVEMEDVVEVGRDEVEGRAVVVGGTVCRQTADMTSTEPGTGAQGMQQITDCSAVEGCFVARITLERRVGRSGRSKQDEVFALWQTKLNSVACS